MAVEQLKDIVSKLLTEGKGLLAADESTNSANKRLGAFNIEPTKANRLAFRDLLFTTAGIERYLSGIILFDETIRQTDLEHEVLFADLLQQKGILAGIKVDEGLQELPNLPGENITAGLDGLGERLDEYYRLGARFTKWRALITIDGDRLPSQGCLVANAAAMARYAAICQNHNLVPIVEPEVLLEGSHSLKRSGEVLSQTLRVVLEHLQLLKVDLSGLLLKSSMVLPGTESGETATPEQVAAATLTAFHAAVPKEVPGIVFLSGGQTPVAATANLNAIAKLGQQPWRLSFSYSRALQEPVLQAWKGQPENRAAAQAIFLKRLQNTAAALKGEYKPEMDKL